MSERRLCGMQRKNFDSWKQFRCYRPVATAKLPTVKLPTKITDCQITNCQITDC
jgi:hypothetical protein